MRWTGVLVVLVAACGGGTVVTPPIPPDPGGVQPSYVPPPPAYMKEASDAAAPPMVDAPCGRAKVAEGRTRREDPRPPKPRRGVFFDEPTYHTCVARVTDHNADGLDTFAREDYSRRQAFNADDSLFLATSRAGSWYVYDAKTFELKQALSVLTGDAEPQWHPKDPNVLFWGRRDGGLEIFARDLATGKDDTYIDLRGKLPWAKAARAWTKSEGSPSRDARYWGFQVETEDFKILGFAIWDAVEKKLVGSMPSKVRPDHVSMTPSGRWITVSQEDGTWAYSPDFKQKKQLHKRTEHSDIAVGPDGHDVYVSIDYQNDGNIFMVDIDTGKRTDLIRTYVDHAATALHISGKAYDKPGWVLVSTYKAGGPPQWYMNKVFAMELAPRPRVYELAHHHGEVKDQYFAEPHGTVNRTFTRVMFNSNWGVPGSLDVDAYMIRLPEGAFP